MINFLMKMNRQTKKSLKYVVVLLTLSPSFVQAGFIASYEIYDPASGLLVDTWELNFTTNNSTDAGASVTIEYDGLFDGLDDTDWVFSPSYLYEWLYLDPTDPDPVAVMASQYNVTFESQASPHFGLAVARWQGNSSNSYLETINTSTIVFNSYTPISERATAMSVNQVSEPELMGLLGIGFFSLFASSMFKRRKDQTACIYNNSHT